jgi:hypothetical protein
MSDYENEMDMNVRRTHNLSVFETSTLPSHLFFPFAASLLMSRLIDCVSRLIRDHVVHVNASPRSRGEDSSGYRNAIYGWKALLDS